jgi:hypothetical protein
MSVHGYIIYRYKVLVYVQQVATTEATGAPVGE